MRDLSLRLTRDLGEGFSEQSLRNMRQFYALFPIRSTLWSELSWSHYKLLIRVESKKPRLFYAKEAVQGHWSVRALERQIYSHYYERLLSSRNKSPVKKESQSNAARLKDGPRDFIKEPYVLEFLNLKSDASYRERDLEAALLSKLQMFLLELGRGFSFVARQKRMVTETNEFYIDLVFYNYTLKCFVLIELLCGAPHKSSSVASAVMWRSALGHELSRSEAKIEDHINDLIIGTSKIPSALYRRANEVSVDWHLGFHKGPEPLLSSQDLSVHREWLC